MSAKVESVPIVIAAVFAASCAMASSAWSRYLDAPREYSSFCRIVFSEGERYSFSEFDVEVYSQGNGPNTWQRIMMAVPKGLKGRAPCVVVPFYFPEAMLGFNPADGSLESEFVSAKTNLSYYAEISYMSDLARRGYITISADAYYLTYRDHERPWWSYLPGFEDNAWQRVGEALLEDWPQWTGIGKLVFDTRLLVDFAVADPRVDRSRIGMIGHSLGGKMAFYAGMTDPRVKVVVASDFGIGWTQTNWGDCWYWGDKLDEVRARGMSNVDLLSMSGGKPFCLIAGKYDDADSGLLVSSAKGYEQHPERLLFIHHGKGHRPPPDATARGYEFLDKHLRGKN